MDVGSVYGSYYETAKSYMGLRKEEKQAGFAEKVTDKSQVSSEDMTLEEYKEYFNEKMSGLYTHPSQRGMNWVIDITDAAYKRMQSDPEYEKKILDALAGGSLLLIPMACSLFGIPNDVAMQVVGIGFIIGVIQDSVETALNSSSDLLLSASAEFRQWRKECREITY